MIPNWLLNLKLFNRLESRLAVDILQSLNWFYIFWFSFLFSFTITPLKKIPIHNQVESQQKDRFKDNPCQIKQLGFGANSTLRLVDEQLIINGTARVRLIIRQGWEFIICCRTSPTLRETKGI